MSKGFILDIYLFNRYIVNMIKTFADKETNRIYNLKFYRCFVERSGDFYDIEIIDYH